MVGWVCMRIAMGCIPSSRVLVVPVPFRRRCRGCSRIQPGQKHILGHREGHDRQQHDIEDQREHRLDATGRFGFEPSFLSEAGAAMASGMG